MEKGCARQSTGPQLTIQSAAVIEGGRLSLGTACLIEIAGGSLTIRSATVTAQALDIVLGPGSSLVIDKSTLSGTGPTATLTVTSSGNGQTVTLSKDTVHFTRGTIVEVGLGSGSTTGVKDLTVEGTTVTSDSPVGVGIQFISKGRSAFSDDTFRAARTPALASAVTIESTDPASCTIGHVTGFAPKTCVPMGGAAPRSAPTPPGT